MGRRVESFLLKIYYTVVNDNEESFILVGKNRAFKQLQIIFPMRFESSLKTENVFCSVIGDTYFTLEGL